MQHAESVHYSENFGKEPLSLHGLKPYEIEEIDGEFVACLPIRVVVDEKGKRTPSAYAENKFASREEAFEAVRMTKEDLGIADKLN